MEREREPLKATKMSTILPFFETKTIGRTTYSRRHTRTRSTINARGSIPKAGLMGPKARAGYVSRKVSLKFTLLKVQNLPSPKSTFVLKIRHSAQKIQDKLTGTTEIDFKDFDISKRRPTFFIQMEQDSEDELNVYSDEPLAILLYKVFWRNESGALEADEPTASELAKSKYEEVHIPYAQGNLDLLVLFSKDKPDLEVNIFLYPMSTKYVRNESMSACRTMWKISSKVALLKEAFVGNLAFITFESIYNCPKALLDGIDGDDVDEHDEPRALVADLYFQATSPQKEHQLNKVKICSFTMTTVSRIAEQNIKIEWESLKSWGLHRKCVGSQTGCIVSLHRLFSNLMCTEGVQFNFDKINTKEDVAIVCNSLHRFMLNEEEARSLEDCIAFNRYHVLLEISKLDRPEQVLLTGTIDLSVLLYPKVNSTRFCVKLEPPKKRPGGKTRTSLDSGTSPPTFAIISACFVEPLTEASSFQGRREKLPTSALQTCDQIDPPVQRDLSKVCIAHYDDFDDLIVVFLVEFIEKRGITKMEDCIPYFCDQIKNMRNVLCNLISCDFNIRYPTRSNIEFTNLMARVYKELESRIHKLLINRKAELLQKHNIMSQSAVTRCFFEHFSLIKMLMEVGPSELTDFLHTKLIRPDSKFDSYFEFLYNVERLRFDKAKEYLAIPLKSKHPKGVKTLNYIEYYIDYIEKKANETVYNEALGALIHKLRFWIDNYPKDIVGWVLLHCLYAHCEYRPGMSYTRMKYEDLMNGQWPQMEETPTTCWHIYNNYKPEFRTVKGELFYQVMESLINLGLYKFAEFVFNRIAQECEAVENYLMRATFRLFQKELDTFEIKTFSTGTGPRATEQAIFLEMINGHLEFARDNKENACQYYERVLKMDLSGLTVTDVFICKLRYAQELTERGLLEEAIHTYKGNIFEGFPCIYTCYQLGKIFYKLNRLKEAEEYFSRSTKFRVHVPNVWAYLALINLKLGENFRALECCVQDRNSVISQEILDELDKIDPATVKLNVDVPRYYID